MGWVLSLTLLDHKSFQMLEFLLLEKFIVLFFVLRVVRRLKPAPQRLVNRLLLYIRTKEVAVAMEAVTEGEVVVVLPVVVGRLILAIIVVLLDIFAAIAKNYKLHRQLLTSGSRTVSASIAQLQQSSNYSSTLACAALPSATWIIDSGAGAHMTGSLDVEDYQ
ncbi:hypothetical protein NL676_032855 [Syzygium grande]|nr:hypothetical protein NL676_032855 [Syzygium grande]